ncbi:MAG: hypothetical protein LBC35_05325 [Coriobacteriales bacterium]|nr:hypothetical protein [Coriobacteriales bacterium]
MQKQDSQREYGGQGFIITWTLLIMLGLTIEFLGRLLSYEANPFFVSYPFLAVLTGIVAAFITLAGCLLLMNGSAQQLAMARRHAVLLIGLGAAMLAGSFVFKQVIPLIFG